MQQKVKQKSVSIPPIEPFYMRHRETDNVYKVPVRRLTTTQDGSGEWVSEATLEGSLGAVRVRAYLDHDFDVTRVYTVSLRGITRHEIVPRADYAAHQSFLLQGAIRFSDADLKANQNGKLTQRQRRLCIRVALAGLWRQTYPALAGLLFCHFFFVNGEAASISNGYIPPAFLIFGSLILLVSLVVIMHIHRKIVQFTEAIRVIRRGEVVMYSGSAHPLYDRQGKKPISKTYLADVSFVHVPSQTYIAFIDGEYYDIYALPGFPVILSAQMRVEP